MTVYRALSPISMGNAPAIPAGQTVPEKFTDSDGTELPVDFERLLELGVVIEETVAKQAEKDAQDAQEKYEKAAEKASAAATEAEIAAAHAQTPAPKPTAAAGKPPAEK